MGPPNRLGRRYAQGLGLDIHQGELDARDGLGRDAARALPGGPQHVPEAHLVGTRGAAQEQGLEVFDGADDAVGGPVIAALAVPGDAVVRLDLDENPGAPAPVHDEGLDVGDFHFFALLPPTGGGQRLDDSIRPHPQLTSAWPDLHRDVLMSMALVFSPKLLRRSP